MTLHFEKIAPCMLDVQHLNAWYGQAQVLFDVAFRVHEGEVVTLLGRNGAGKSTILKSILHLVRRQGNIEFMGQDLSALATHEVASLGIALVPEDRRIFSDLSVLENLEIARQSHRQDAVLGARTQWQVSDVLALFPHLTTMLHRKGYAMSGGEQQMLSVARALMGNPHLLILDEPTQGVSPLMVENMVQMVIALKKKGVAVLLSEQNHAFVSEVSDRVYELQRGQLLGERSKE